MTRRKYTALRPKIAERLSGEITRDCMTIANMVDMPIQEVPIALIEDEDRKRLAERLEKSDAWKDAVKDLSRNRPFPAVKADSGIAGNYLMIVHMKAMLASVVEEAQTVIFDADQATYLGSPALADRYRHSMDLFIPPFRSTIFQFSTPLPVTSPYVGLLDLADQGAVNIDDQVLLLAFFCEPDGDYANAMIYYKSGIINQIDFSVKDPWSSLENDDHPSKSGIINMAVGMVQYINAESVEMEEVVPPTKEASKRRKLGRKIPDSYHYTYINPSAPQRPARATGQGTAHSYAYPVRGHNRTYSDGRRIRIGSYWCNLEAGITKEMIRVVRGEKRE